MGDHQGADLPAGSERSLPFVGANFEGIAHLLRDQPLMVPPFQRAYAWTAEQVLDFWQDLNAALLAGQPVYFLGSIVISEAGDDGRATVIDGQQRLATSTMLLAAVRDAFALNLDLERAAVVDRDYVAASSLRSTIPSPRLLLAEDDREFFSAHVVRGDRSSQPETESERKIAAAYKLLQEQLRRELQQSGSGWADLLFRWIEFLDKQAGAIVVRVRDDADAYLIFETLNARGLELTPADVIKNYVFALNRGDYREVQRDWGDSVRTLEARVEDADFITFLRHFWNSRAGATRERGLYASIRNEVRSAPAAVSFCRQIAVAAPLYAAIVAPDDDFWLDWSPQARDATATLARLGVQQYRPLLLAALEKLPEPDVERLLQDLVSWAVRGLIVGGTGGGTSERYYAEAATRVTNGRLRSAADIEHELVTVVPSDQVFHEAFVTRRVLRLALARYYLSALQRYEVDPSPYAVYVTAAQSEASVVPVLPRRPLVSGDWPGFEHDELHAWSLRLGNMLLLDPRKAKELPSTADARVAMLQGSDPITSLQVREWTPTAITDRQRLLADVAVRAWPTVTEA